MARSATHLYTLKEGESCKVFEGGFVICHPDRPPFVIDGRETEGPRVTGVDWPVRTIPISGNGSRNTQSALSDRRVR